MKIRLSFICCVLLWAQAVCLAQKPELVVQTGHTGLITAAAYGRDGRTVATGSMDGVIKIWDARDWRELKTFVGHVGEDIDDLYFEKSGRTLVSWSEHRKLRWNIVTGERAELNEAKDGTFFRKGRSSLDGHWLAVCDSETVELHDRRKQNAPIKILTHDSTVADVAFSGNGQLLATLSRRRGIQLWETATGKLRTTLSDYEVEEDLSAKVAVSLSADGKRLAAAVAARVIVWDISTPKATKIWEVKEEDEISTGWALAFSPDGKTLLSGGTGLTLLQLPQGKDEEGKVQFVYEFTSPGEHCLISKDKRFLATLDTGVVMLWDAASGTMDIPFADENAGIECMAFSPDGKMLVCGGGVGGFDNTVKLWTRETDELVVLRGHTRSVAAVCFSPDSKLIASASGIDSGTAIDNVIRVWDVRTKQARVLSLPPSCDLTFPELQFSFDGRFLLCADQWGVASWNTVNWDMKFTAAEKMSDYGLSEFQLDDTGQYVSSYSRISGNFVVSDVQTGQAIFKEKVVPDRVSPGSVTSVAFAPGSRLVAIGDDRGYIKIFDLSTHRNIATFEAHAGGIRDIAFSEDRKILASLGEDGKFSIWNLKDLAKPNQLCTLVALQEHEWNADEDWTGWAVVDPAGRYDSSGSGRMENIHWVVGLEPIDLEQLKARYYEPGLLAKVLGFNKEPLRDVKAFDNAKLYPEVKVQPPAAGSTQAAITLENRGGGIGKVQVFINGVEVAADARGPQVNPDAAQATIPFDLKDNPLLKPGEQNVVEVKAFNAEGYLSSRGFQLLYTPPGEKTAEPPHLWAIVAGVSDYHGSTLDLRYAAKDAADFAKAIEVGAQRVFPGRVHLSLLTAVPAGGGSTPDPAKLPTRANIVQALQAARAAKPGDVLVVYLSGHGVNWGGQDGDYYYLAADAESGDLKDPAIRETTALSGHEISDLLIKIPALKRVLILDTCASGRLAESLAQPRAVSSSVLRSWDRMKDRTGMFVLAGCAADAPSYEASRYGQGLLTYSLLQGIKSGEGLRDKQWVDVSTLFRHTADVVPDLAKGIGGIQRPMIASKAEAGSFDIGRIETEADRASIPLSLQKPVVVRPNFQEEARPRDSLGLTKRLEDALRDVSARGAEAPLIFWDVPEYSEAYTISGRYRVDGAAVTVSVFLYQDETEAAKFTMTGETEKPDELAARILEKARDVLAKAKP